MGRSFGLTVKWTVSRGRDTHGYNICTLYFGKEKLASTCGGGYDMVGTVVGEWLAKEYSKQLLTIAQQAHDSVLLDKNGKFVERCNCSADNTLYGFTAYRNPNGEAVGIGLDGACGVNSMIQIAAAIGVKVKVLSESSVYVEEGFERE